MTDRITLNDTLRTFIQAQRVAHLATSDAQGHPHVVAICYAFDGARFYSPLDEKPKRVGERQLKRVRNIEERGEAMLLIDRYDDDDWSNLAYVQVTCHAALLQPGEMGHDVALRLLRERYTQYRSMVLEDHAVIVLTPQRVVSWGHPLADL
jgi:PPOX class probable F420-dependent enzyme